MKRCEVVYVRMVVFALTLIRHGETGANKENIIQGQMDVPLSEAGLKQAHLLGHRLQNQKYTHIFASDLSRAKQTAQTILEKSHYSVGPIVQDPRLRERKFGEVEGKTFNELKRLARRANQSVPSFTPSGAETVQQVRHRAVLFFQEICQLLLKSQENGKKEQNEPDCPSNGIESDINRINVGTGGVKRRRHSSVACGTEGNGLDCKDTVNNGVKSVAVQRLKRERSELLSSDDETSSDLLKTVGKHLETLSSNCHYLYNPVGQDCSSDQLCVYVPSRISHNVKKDERIKSNCKQNHPERQTVTVSNDNFPSTFKDPTTFKLYSPSAMHDRMNGDCPNVSLSPLTEQSLSWQSLSELHRKTSIDSSNDEVDVSPALTANVLIVSHGGLLRELIRHFVEDLGCTIPGGKGQAFRISPNTGLSKFTVSVLENDEKPKVICLLIHDKDHLVGN
uniref:Fructose-2,6-bisphosphatase TIGAR n=1 Tax=Hemiscolopendra marginata TaxID=943146 RepID=A0A646QJ07_9MYRI